MVIYKALIPIPEDGDGDGGVAHNSEGMSKANPLALTVSHRSGCNYLTDREMERGRIKDGTEAAVE